MKKIIASAVAMMMFIPTWGQLKLSESEWQKLQAEKINTIEWKQIKLSYPRQVGKNSRKDIHGYGPSIKLCVLQTLNKQGLGEVRGGINNQKVNLLRARTVGKKVLELIDMDTRLVKDEYRDFDIAIYDLIGVLLNKPAYLLFGEPVSHQVKCYSGMIYMDDLEHSTKEAGEKCVLGNCRYDYDYGYRYFKLKIGRGGMWMPREEGLKRDIEITKLIHEKYPDVKLLVDANDAYTVDECIAYLEGIEPVRIYWMEEPFKENEKDYAILREWQKVKAPELLLADGEFKPQKKELLSLGEKNLLDVYLQDIIGYGFTNWIQLLPELKKRKMVASPHNWGSLLKTIYSAHLAMAMGNIPIVEGVTCKSDELDFGDFDIRDGYFIPTVRPGFGITLK